VTVLPFFLTHDEQRRLANTIGTQLNKKAEAIRKLRADYDGRIDTLQNLHENEVKRGKMTEVELVSCQKTIASLLKQLKGEQPVAQAVCSKVSYFSMDAREH
jgi:two-component sensor histidine kinase